MSNDLVTVATFTDPVEANLAKNRLEASGVRASLANEETVDMDWLLGNALGWIRLEVGDQDADAARAVLNDEDELEASSAKGPEDFSSAIGEGEPIPEPDPEDGDDDDAADDFDRIPTVRERNAERAFRGAVLGILFFPIQLYVLYLFGQNLRPSEESIGHRQRTKAIIAAVLVSLLLVGPLPFHPTPVNSPPAGHRERVAARSRTQVQRGPSDVFRIIGDQEHGRFANVFGSTEPAPWQGCAGLAHELVAERFMLAGRVDPARLDHVDVDPVRVEFGGDCKGELVQTALAGVIGDAAGIRRVSVSARDEDDFPTSSALDHVPRHQLAHVKPAGECPLDHLGKRVGIELQKLRSPLQCRIAHEDVDALGSLDRSSDHRLAGSALERIAVDQHSLAAERLNFGNDLLGLCCPLAIVDRHISPGPGHLGARTRAPIPRPAPVTSAFLPKSFISRSPRTSFSHERSPTCELHQTFEAAAIIK